MKKKLIKFKAIFNVYFVFQGSEGALLLETDSDWSGATKRASRFVYSPLWLAYGIHFLRHEMASIGAVPQN